MVEILKNIWAYYQEQEFAYQFVSAMIAILVISSMLLFFSIMISRSIKNRREYLEATYRKDYEEILTNFLFGENVERDSAEYKKMVSTIKGKLDTKLQRKTFVKVLIELHKNLTGQSAKSLEFLYQDLKLQKHAFRAIKKGRWFEKAYAFLTLSEFNVRESADIIMKYTDVRNKILRDEAQFALIRLLGIQGLKFVPKVTTIISNWQQLRILEQLKRMHRDDIPSFRPWLKNKNFSVVVFGLKLIAYFNQVDARDDIVGLLDHEDDRVQKTALYAIAKLQLEDTTKHIIENYDRFEDPKLKIQSIRTLMEILNPADKDFFFDRLKDDIYEVVLYSAKALDQLGMKKDLVFKSSHLNNFNRKIVIHALDERI